MLRNTGHPKVLLLKHASYSAFHMPEIPGESEPLRHKWKDAVYLVGSLDLLEYMFTFNLGQIFECLVSNVGKGYPQNFLVNKTW